MFSFFFFVVAVVSSGAVALFYHAKFAEPGLRRSHQPRLHLGSVFSLRFDYPLSLLLPHSHPFPLTSSPPPKTNFTHQVCLSSPPQPPSFLHLSPFDQEPACSFLLLPFALFCVYSAIFPPFSRSKTLFAPDRYDAPGLLNRWRGYFCSSPWGHQTLCLSACLRWHPLQASSIWKCSSRVKAMFVHAAVFRSILLTTSVHAGQQKRCWIFLITHSTLTCFNAAWLSLQSLSFAYFFLFLVSEQV